MYQPQTQSIHTPHFFPREGCGLYFLEGDTMPRTQTERLEQDVKDLEHYALRLKKKGKIELMQKKKKKKEYLETRLENKMSFAS